MPPVVTMYVASLCPDTNSSGRPDWFIEPGHLRVVTLLRPSLWRSRLYKERSKCPRLQTNPNPEGLEEQAWALSIQLSVCVYIVVLVPSSTAMMTRTKVTVDAGREAEEMRRRNAVLSRPSSSGSGIAAGVAGKGLMWSSGITGQYSISPASWWSCKGVNDLLLLLLLHDDDWCVTCRARVVN